MNESMELGLSLGGDCSNNINSNNSNTNSASKPFGLSKNGSVTDGPDPFSHKNNKDGDVGNSELGLGFCMALGSSSNGTDLVNGRHDDEGGEEEEEEDDDRTSSEHTRDDPLQLDLLPRAPVPRRWSSENGSSGSSGNLGMHPAAPVRGFDVNRFAGGGSLGAAADEVTSPNSVASSFQMDFSLFRGNGNLVSNHKRDFGAGANDVVEGERGSSRASDEDENGPNGRKKLRLSKEQSAYLEESFKEHNTLNPKQKLALAKQLNLRPRQVEVWFQNRRARTKLKQTEVDCEYLKRCCETLTEENRRLHKELAELRALKSSNPFYMQLPATTLTMCPSCERVATTNTGGAPPPPSTTAATTTTSANPATSPPTTAVVSPPASSSPESTAKAIPFGVARPKFFPLAHTTTNQHPHQSAAS
ncbi:OLC1v1001659C1 [Oldenlandia corymbosa var. corymbosa]|uniref:OLC1v1001659C1 n=1 Tax=Oldenlandia corymbosa var. corymbosa TaxID=529605 RepID=A0AAV1D5Q0_OLDCO|nr:OLC1v1001659C1 [Oldenlandia corymbosa var. corymbosa]